MTAQISDEFLLDGTTYAVAAASEDGLFDPADLGLSPTGASTANYNGYVATFAVLRQRLTLRRLRASLYVEGEHWVRFPGPPIFGVYPNDESSDPFGFNNVYEGLDLPLGYSGGLLVADEFIRPLYVHAGWHAAWKYRRVVELVFVNGRLTERVDRSKGIAEIRDVFAKELGPDRAVGSVSRKDAEEVVGRVFDRDYGLTTWWEMREEFERLRLEDPD